MRNADRVAALNLLRDLIKEREFMGSWTISLDNTQEDLDMYLACDAVAQGRIKCLEASLYRYDS